MTGYTIENINKSVQEIYDYEGSAKTTVFISHKYDDLEEIKGLNGFLETR
ncbi:hypothetical protein KQI69_00020 [Eubacterium sp. MSJ-13]|nr:hypothetical protein [Eubacterium sp. MSJ-13]MBU5477589.1 hypothetical protein [Eubacterium sp. MSJ-13]